MGKRAERRPIQNLSQEAGFGIDSLAVKQAAGNQRPRMQPMRPVPMGPGFRSQRRLGNLLKTVESESELRALTRKGLLVSAVVELARSLQLPEQDVASSIGIAARTWTRRRTQDTRLTQTESDRLLELSRVIAYAEEVLGSKESARGWIQHPIPALNGEVPLHLMDTSAGVREVMDVLGRIEFGVYS